MKILAHYTIARRTGLMGREIYVSTKAGDRWAHLSGSPVKSLWIVAGSVVVPLSLGTAESVCVVYPRHGGPAMLAIVPSADLRAACDLPGIPCPQRFGDRPFVLS